MINFIFSLLQQYGDPIIFFALALEYLGFPFIPGEALMAFMGFLGLKTSFLSIIYSILFATAGTFTGSMIAWFIAYKYGEKVVLKIGKPFSITKERLDKYSISFNKHRSIVIIFSRFIPGVRHIIPYLGGLYRVEAKKFAMLSLIGSVLWCVTFVGLGALLGSKWQIVVNIAKTYSLLILLLIAFIFVTVKFFKEHQKIIFAIAVPLILFIKLSEEIVNRELSVFDNTIYNFLKSFIAEGLTDFMKFLSFLGSGLALTLIALIIFFVVHKKKKYSFYSWMIGLNLILSFVLSEFMKFIFHRERPSILRLIDVSGYSFPSGHSMVGFCFYAFIAYILWVNVKSRLKIPVIFLLMILIVAIGVSRIYLGVHYASDVLGGFSAGFAWLAVFIPIIESFHKKQKNNRKDDLMIVD